MELDDMIEYLKVPDREPCPTVQPLTPPPLPIQISETKKQFLLPWWCAYLAWILVVTTVALSGTFTMLFSFKWGKEKSSEWLTAFILSFVQSVIFVQPLKVIGIAVVIALIVKPKSQVAPDEDVELIGMQSVDTDLSHRVKQIEHRKPYEKRFLDESRLKEMRVKRDKEVKMWMIFREIISYFFYFMVLSTLVYDNKDPNSFRSKNELAQMFVHKTFTKIRTLSDFWEWTNKTLVPNLYADTWYNDDETHWRIQYFTKDMTYYRIGSPRLRLLKVTEGSCTILEGMSSLINKCYDAYGVHGHDDGDYSESWQLTRGNTTLDINPWTYQTNLQLDGVPIIGNVDAYGGGGYVAELGTKPEQAIDILNYLKETRWLDRASRALFVEFNLFNPNTNLFSVVNLILELPATGGCQSFPLIQTLRLYNYVGGRAIFRLILDLAFVVFTLYFFIVEAKKMRQQGRSYTRSFWNVMEVGNLIGAVTACALYGVHFVFTRLTIRKFHQNKDTFTNFQYVLNWDSILGYVLGFLIFISTIKLLRLIRFNKKVAELMTTLDVAAKPLAGFLVFFIIVYMAFAQFCYLVFGRTLKEYSTFMSTLESLFSMMLMNFNYRNIEESDRTLGPVFFFVYVIVLAFIIINLLVSILNESFNSVKSRNMLSNDDHRIVDYILRNFKRVLGFNEWRQETKRHNDDIVHPVYVPHPDDTKDTTIGHNNLSQLIIPRPGQCTNEAVDVSQSYVDSPSCTTKDTKTCNTYNVYVPTTVTHKEKRRTSIHIMKTY